MHPAETSPIAGIHFSYVIANGIQHRLASTKARLGRQRRDDSHIPLVLLLHGWPESWYSWRHQLLGLRNEPYLLVAPDMRGFGSTALPSSSQNDVNQYNQIVLARDMVGIAAALGYNRFFLVGHDWGCMLAWSVALLYPEKIRGVCGLSVPYAGTPKRGLLSMLQRRHGRCLPDHTSREVQKQARFHYILHHCLPYCADEYAKHANEFLYRIYAYRLGCDVHPGTPEVSPRGLMFPEPERHTTLDAHASPGLWQRIPRPTSLPSWLSQTDLDYITGEFQRAGFHGGLFWYRAAEINHKLLKTALTAKDGTLRDKIQPKALFLIGEHDALLEFYGGKPQIRRKMNHFLPNIVEEPVFVKGCGHWIQQERPELVNEHLKTFFRTTVSDESQRLHQNTSRL